MHEFTRPRDNPPRQKKKEERKEGRPFNFYSLSLSLGDGGTNAQDALARSALLISGRPVKACVAVLSVRGIFMLIMGKEE